MSHWWQVKATENVQNTKLLAQVDMLIRVASSNNRNFLKLRKLKSRSCIAEEEKTLKFFTAVKVDLRVNNLPEDFSARFRGPYRQNRSRAAQACDHPNLRTSSSTRARLSLPSSSSLQYEPCSKSSRDNLEVSLCPIVIGKCHSVLYTFLSGLGPLINYGVLKQSTSVIIQLP